MTAPLLLLLALMALLPSCASDPPPAAKSAEADRVAAEADQRFAAGEHQPGLQLATRALVMRQARFGPNHPEVARSFVQLGDMRRAVGQIDWARQSYRRAAEILAQHRQTHPGLAAAVERRLADLRSP